MSRAFIGATVNAGGTKIATAKVIGTAPLDTSKASNDAHTMVAIGSMSVPIAKAIAMGHLQRNAAGVLEETNPPQAYTRVG